MKILKSFSNYFFSVVVCQEFLEKGSYTGSATFIQLNKTSNLHFYRKFLSNSKHLSTKLSSNREGSIEITSLLLNELKFSSIFDKNTKKLFQIID